MIPIRFTDLDGFDFVLHALQQGHSVGALGLIKSVRLPFALALQKELHVPLLYISAQTNRAQLLMEELPFWDTGSSGQLFAEPVPLFYEDADWEQSIRSSRIAVLEKLSQYWLPEQKRERKDALVITSVKALMTRTLPRRDFLSARKKVRVHEQQDLKKLSQHILRLGYEFHEIVTQVGQFSHRGGILDIWLVQQAHPIRLEFFGDEIDSIRSFDELSQRSIEQLDECVLLPAREFLLPAEGEEEIGRHYTERDICILHPHASSLLSYFPEETLICLDDQDILITVSEEVEKDALELRAALIRENSLEKDFPTPYLSWSELYDQMQAFNPINMSFSGEETLSIFRKNIQPAPRFGGKMDDFFAFTEIEAQQNHEVEIVSRQTERLQKMWLERNAAQNVSVSERVHFYNANLNAGWKIFYKDASVQYCITDEEIFGWQPAIRARRRRKQVGIVFDFGSFLPGDYVVHYEYGIALYHGLVKRTLNGVEKEYLLLEFADGDELYVPVYHADRISLYVGPDARPPKLSSLSSPNWQGVKEHVKQAVQYVAKDLLELYAKREAVEGYAFQADSDWQRELEASFPYEETEDQLQAIEDVKRDMERPKPMDRLLCGDVGYGKTEVAVRAAFKAVMGGKQVAMLVPTTVLAQQHFDTFRQRLAPFPVAVEMLSRFRSEAEQEEILRALAVGEIDIIIGTHRLLQKDVQFKDLGLLIIDEEQRFGVMHKEFFKKMREKIDVLTLTATPIPRTLYMALAGIRDISMINTAPNDRLPVTTHVGAYDPELVRRAILREIDRGGQVFFVHNRVQTMHTSAAQLQALVPEARIAVAHGQMPEQQLATVMRQFTEQKVDVLLSTSIIESGLDIPNANTLIVDGGDAFGLSQLYQLRGRVGRGTQKAYAYFFFNAQGKPTVEGLDRLEVIAENSQLGSGYTIAMRDLEMRGAGDLLGTQQHGQIAAVGFHLYTRLLADAVKHMRQSKAEEPIAEQFKETLAQPDLRPFVTVDLPLAASIPISYIPDAGLRLEMYRKLACIINEADFQRVEEEFRDRFGPPPQDVLNLIWQNRIKLMAEKAGLSSITMESEQLVLRYPPLLKDQKRRELISLAPYWRSGKNEYWPYFSMIGEEWKVHLEEALYRLLEHEKRKNEASLQEKKEWILN